MSELKLIQVNTLRPRQNGRHFADDIFNRIFLNENIWIPIKISLKFVPKGSINNNPALVQILAWRRPGDKQLSEPMMVNLLTHICVTRPQWVNKRGPCQYQRGPINMPYCARIWPESACFDPVPARCYWFYMLSSPSVNYFSLCL